jgi:hypothetical protein
MAATVVKVSVALGLEELEWARDGAERLGTSVSSVLTEAARAARELEAQRARQQTAWDEYLAWATDGKGLPEGVLEASRRELAALDSK